ncbi:MAG: hypothetical protein RLZZ09_499 [Pseudomonadota bacterium]|jgi:type I restriction enzyme S subunit
MKEWPSVKLGDLLVQIDRMERVDPDVSYHLLGVRLEGNGPFIRETVAGTETSAGRLNQVRAGDFIYSRLFAWRGAFGVITDAMDGCFVSNEFPIFRADQNLIEIGYLARWFQLPSVWRKVEENCTGSTPTTRNRFKEQFFFDLEIPLPPLTEQQALVARLDALAKKTRQLEAHLDAVELISSSLLLSMHHKLAGGRRVQLTNVLELRELSESIMPTGSYPQVGVRGFGGGLFPKAAISGTETSYKAFNRLYEGAIVLSQVKGWEGAIARCPKDLDGWFVSPEYRTFRCKPGLASDEYFGELVRTEWFWSQLQDATRGVGARRERTRPEQFLNIELPMPHFDAQLRIVEILKRQIPLKAKHTAIREANAALLPAALERVFGSGNTGSP